MAKGKNRSDRFGAPAEALVFHIPGQEAKDLKDVGGVELLKEGLPALPRSKTRRQQNRRKGRGK